MNDDKPSLTIFVVVVLAFVTGLISGCLKWLNENGSETAKRLYQIEEAKKVGELAFEFEDAKAQDLEYHKLKELMLKQGGTGAYPDADRITQLSPWQQVGFAQEQIRQKMLGYEDQLAHSLQNGTEPISLGGITYTAQEIKDNNLAFPMKQAAIEVYADKIYTNLGLDRYSDEMLKMSKVNETIQKAKDSQLAKYRQQYNIESSMKTRQKAKLEWQRSEKTAVDLQHLLIKVNVSIQISPRIYNLNRYGCSFLGTIMFSLKSSFILDRSLLKV